MNREASSVERRAVEIPDHDVRQRAETTFDRNVVVVAGAGTGKTTLLVNRLVHLLMREPRPVAITRLVALTFTNKAATEMRVRLRERLVRLQSGEDARRTGEDPGAVTVEELRARYGLMSDEIGRRARAALGDLEKAQIGTLHSFAAHLLRLYPLESGVDPNFQTDDDKGRFEEHIAASWDAWLDRELRPDNPQTARWRRVLAEHSLEQLRDLAYALCSELIPLDEVRRQVNEAVPEPAVREWLVAKRDRADFLLRSHEPPKNSRKIERMLGVARSVIANLAERGPEGLTNLDAMSRQELQGELGGQPPKGWSEEEFREGRRIIALAQQALALDRSCVQDLLALLVPFVQEVRTSFRREGWVTFDGLLAFARDLLRSHHGIRERLKQEYQAVLVDEFQDTDPVQYEIILYLAERLGRCGTDWRTIELEPGKLFIVGDPKQSIYAFRRADIEAFERVVNKITAASGEQWSLTTNFRSDERVLEVINPVFDRLLVPRENLQPPNVRLVVRPGRRSRVRQPGVELRLVRPTSEEQDVDSAAVTRLEADELARWIKEELLGQEILEVDGCREPLRPGHIALLFRKLTQAQDYLDALRRYGLQYVTDGEKHFYRRQEVIDLVNVLRAVDNPRDTIALVGVLRSALGGVTDRELVELRERGALDYRRVEGLDGWGSQRAEPVRELYRRLDELRRILPALPLPEAMDCLFDTLPMLELAAVSLHGEQAVANLLKVRQMAEKLAERPHLTFTAFVELMMARLEEQPEEAESALAEESLEAIRVLTIHKAKGLEFPVVILPGLHHGTGRSGPALPVVHDWTTGVYGIRFGEKCDLGSLLVSEKARLREEAEQRRLLYVGMTRARERLILSGGVTSRASAGTFLSLLKEALGEGLGDPNRTLLHVESARLPQTIVTGTDRPPRPSRQASRVQSGDASNWRDAVARWAERDRRWTAIRSAPLHLSPTSLRRAGRPALSHEARGGDDAERSRLIGTLAHRVLQHWEFTQPPERLLERIATCCRVMLPPEWGGRAEEIERELREVFQAFVGSDPYHELQRAEILGREVPFAIKWEGDGQRTMGKGSGELPADSFPSPIAHSPSPAPCVMDGVIDVIYRLDGVIHLADYKTDWVEDGQLAARATDHAEQARIYREAVSRCLGIPSVGVRVIFLRHGRSVSL